ncbi:MAG: ferritin family protein [Pseudomonadota bacterium]
MSASNQKSLNMLNTALEIEEKGRNHYDTAARECRNELGREVFTLLRDFEVQHVARIREIYDSLKAGGQWSPEASSFTVVADLGEVFRRLAENLKDKAKAEADDLEALQVGISFESASIKFYQDQATAAEDPLEKRFTELMAAEERGHLNLLTDMKQYYVDPESWFMEKDRIHLDGA